MYYKKRSRSYASATSDNFDSYRSINAKFASKCGNSTCNAKIAIGDLIGYNPGLRKVVCKDCWHKWVAGNQEASAYEATGSDCSYNF